MFSKIRQRTLAVGTSLAGDGMLVRLRRTSIALLGAVAAVGLGLIIFIAQLGFPGVFSGPLPVTPSESGSVHDAIALTQKAEAGSPSLSRGPLSRSRSKAHANTRHVAHPASDAGVEGSRQLNDSPGAQPSPPPPSSPTTGPTSEPTTPSPVAVPAPSPVSVPVAAPSPSKSSSDAQPQQSSTGTTKSSGPASAKAKSDADAKPETASTGKSKSQGAVKASIGSTSASKPSGSPVDKAREDQSTAAAPAAAPVKATAPTTSNPAAAKEAADAGK